MALSDRHLVAIKTEVTYGVDPFQGSPTDFLGIIGEPEIVESTVDIGPEEKTADGFGGSVIRYGEKTDVAFTAYLVGKKSAAGSTPPEHDVLWKGCNFRETITAGTSVEYKLEWGRDQSKVPSMALFEAIRDDEDGKYYTRTITGIRGVPTFVFEDGQDARVNFAGVGQYAAFNFTQAGATITSPAASKYSGGKARMKVQGMTFKYNNVAYPITACEITTGMSIDEGHSLSATYAVDSVGLYLANGDKPGGSVTFQGSTSVLRNIIKETQIPNGCKVDSATLEITLSCGGDTITITGTDCVLGAHSRNLANGNYNFDVPLTFLGGLKVVYT